MFWNLWTLRKSCYIINSPITSLIQTYTIFKHHIVLYPPTVKEIPFQKKSVWSLWILRLHDISKVFSNIHQRNNYFVLTNLRFIQIPNFLHTPFHLRDFFRLFGFFIFITKAFSSHFHDRNKYFSHTNQLYLKTFHFPFPHPTTKHPKSCMDSLDS